MKDEIRFEWACEYWSDDDIIDTDFSDKKSTYGLLGGVILNWVVNVSPSSALDATLAMKKMAFLILGMLIKATPLSTPGTKYQPTY